MSSTAYPYLDVESATNIPRLELFEAFEDAFSDYQVRFSMKPRQFDALLKQRGFDAGLCVIARVDGEIAGFWLIGKSAERPGDAYVVATGTSPRHRNSGVARGLFEVLRDRLAKAGFEQCLLEVIETNRAALPLYQKLGFGQRRRLACFKLAQELVLQSREPKIPVLIRLTPLDWALFEPLQSWQPSWQNSSGSIDRIRQSLTVLGAYHADQLQGYAISNTGEAQVLQLAVNPALRRHGIGRALLAHIASGPGRQPLKILNVPCDDPASMAFYQATCGQPFLYQLEMHCRFGGD